MRAIGHRCLVYAAAGATAGCAAYAQETHQTVTTALTGDGGAVVLSLLQAGGLPAVLGGIGWMLGRGGIPVTIQLSETDRSLLRSITRRLAAAMDEDANKANKNNRLDRSLDETKSGGL